MTSIITVDDLPHIFSDVTPIPQEDGPFTVCRIDYPPDFTTAYDYFRAVLQADELSERAFHLTLLCLKFNPANYTVWHFRRKCLWATILCPDNNKDMESILLHELTMTATLGGENPKNYQIWYHRRAVLEYISKQNNTDLLVLFCRHELDYTASVFVEDSKNYHSWCYRQWVLQSLSQAVVVADATTVDAAISNIWYEEIEYANQMIMENDIRNNSAWNQRWFAVHHGQLNKPLLLETAHKEVEYALQGATIDPYNECPWRYFVAIVKEQCQNMEDKTQKASMLQQYLEQAESVKTVLKDANKDPERCPNLSAALVDLLEMKGDEEALTYAKQLVHYLGNDIDPIRAKYWAFRSNQITETLSNTLIQG